MLPLGARVRVTFEKGEWSRVAKPSGGDGWMSRNDLRPDAARPATDSARREIVLSAAKLFLGEPYHWGGRSGHLEGNVESPSGVDCSGLVNVTYRAAGVDVPRDAHEQYMKSQPLSSPADLKPGDLIFLSWTKEPAKITHVMIYAGGDDVIEAVQEQNTVRQTTVKAKLGTFLKDLAVMTPVGGRLAYFGRLLPEPAE
jgi:cell wall-associated NlpC family hydrolase